MFFVKMDVNYNCWHGCHKKSEGCKNCYVFRRDNSVGKDSNEIYKTSYFDLPIKRKRNGEYKYPSGTSFALCFSSDFFIEEADVWRPDVLEMIRVRNDCRFFCITKRPERIMSCIPDLASYDNLDIYCTMENQKRFDERAPIYLNLPIKYKNIVFEPMLEEIDYSAYVDKIDGITCGGESGLDARVIDFAWVRRVHDFCKEKKLDFYFHQTGAKLLVDGKLYTIPRKYQHSQARKAFGD